MIILIPAYEPDTKLLALLEALKRDDPAQRIVVVDDGSGPAYARTFAAVATAGCNVIGHPTNRGKGYALKVGLAYIAERYPDEDVVCADSDGQHTPADIWRVASRLRQRPGTIVLGSRLFAGDVPSRNRIGNAVTREVYEGVTGQRLQDTQTGLRGYPASMLGWLQTIPGGRYEYELEVLLAARRDAIPVVEVPIATVYLDGNHSSHFHVVSDAIRVYLPFLKCSASSLSAFVIDAALFFLFIHLTGSLIFAVVGARLASASANYAVNGGVVFRHTGTMKDHRSGARYAGLVGALLTANYALMSALGALAVPLLAAKLLTEGTLFVMSYRAQRRFVVGTRPPAAASAIPGMDPVGGGRHLPEIAEPAALAGYASRGRQPSPVSADS